MDERRARIQDDLRGLVDGEVRCDDVFVRLYASDASIYEIVPLGIVRPRSVDDVVECVRYAAENHIPIHARGAGSGLAGESVGPGLVIDFSRHLRRVVDVGPDSVRVQPGVVHERLNTFLKTYSRQFGPDPAMSHVTTLGSVVAIDASGSRRLKYGSARDHVRSLQVVLADGSLVELGKEPVTESPTRRPPRANSLLNELAPVLDRNQRLIDDHQPKSVANRSGYCLSGVHTGASIDFPRLLCGSEGTLALITEITLATQPVPRSRGVAIMFFDRLDNAARAVADILPAGPSACDLMDRRHISLARDTEPRYDLLIPPEAEGLLLVEFEGDEPSEVRGKLQSLVDRLRRKRRQAFDARIGLDDEDVDLFWQLARKVVPTLYQLKGSTRPLPFIEDIAIPPAVLPEFLIDMQNVLKRHQITASVFAHGGHGQLHIRPFLDLANPDHTRRMAQLADDMYARVFDVGGTISGEHGDGLSRTPFVPRQYGPLYDVFRDVKRIFDPHNIFNPGKIVGDDPHLATRNLRPVRSASIDATGEPSSAAEPISLQLKWTAPDIVHTARSCNGCGACRSQANDVRMCPIFRYTPGEEATPRAKANLMRALLTGTLDANEISSDAFKEVADLCVNCHQCRLECPASVDIPKLMIEAKGAHVATKGLRFSDWIIARADLLGAVGSRISRLANWAVANRQARWLGERVFGIAQDRKLPRFDAVPFLRRARRRRLTRPTRRAGTKVLYFVDTYANYHDTQLAESLVSVLEHNGIGVYVHPGQVASGMAPLSMGAIESARRLAAQNVGVLAEAIRQGYEVVTSEPSAALCLTHHYPSLIDDDDARLVAENTSEACHYLWRLHRAGKLKLDFKPISATLGYHTPCHVKALEIGTPGENLLHLIPGLRVQSIDRGCSGMAGTYGLRRGNYRSSIRAGWGLISALRHPTLEVGTTECSACKIQMEQGTNKPTIQPLKLLALAYGTMPDVANLLTAHGEELVVT